jgi:hypothetical protein
MTVYATNADVESALGRSLTVSENLHVNALLILASALIDVETNGYKFAPGSYTVGRNVRNRKVVLPATIATVDAVRRINQLYGTVTTLALNANYTLHARTLYVLSVLSSDSQFHGSDAEYLYNRFIYVEVDFTVTAPIPVEIVALVAGMVASTLSDPALAAANAISGSYPVARTTSVAKVWLSASDKVILRPYKQPKMAMDITG